MNGVFMEAVEFTATIREGRIEIPQEYRGRLGEHVRIIILSQETSRTEGRASTIPHALKGRPDMLDQLLEHPRRVEGFTPLKRDQIYERD